MFVDQWLPKEVIILRNTLAKSVGIIKAHCKIKRTRTEKIDILRGGLKSLKVVCTSKNAKISNIG